MKYFLRAVVCLGLVLACQYAQGFTWIDDAPVGEPKRLDVPYVPTPEPVVDEMLRVAQVGPNDILYDLGCGDGRIVITAAKRFGTRGVGVDIDPDRIRDSNENAAEAKVTDRVRFYQQDVFATDFSPATVVALYMLPEINLKLRPKLLEKLKPGSRVVSHNYSMRDWAADQFIRIDESHCVYFWTIPARFQGAWSGPERGSRLLLEQKFQHVTGRIVLQGEKIEIRDGKIAGDKLTFNVDQAVGRMKGPVHFAGNLRGGKITGSFSSGSGTTRNCRLQKISERIY